MIENAKGMFAKAFEVFKKKKQSPQPSPEPKLELSLQPALQQTIGHVPETKEKKQPLESEPKAQDEFEISDLSESIEEVNTQMKDTIVATKAEVLAPKKDEAATEDLSELLREIANDIQPNRSGKKIATIDDFDLTELEL